MGMTVRLRITHAVKTKVRFRLVRARAVGIAYRASKVGMSESSKTMMSSSLIPSTYRSIGR